MRTTPKLTLASLEELLEGGANLNEDVRRERDKLRDLHEQRATAAERVTDLTRRIAEAAEKERDLETRAAEVLEGKFQPGMDRRELEDKLRSFQ